VKEDIKRLENMKENRSTNILDEKVALSTLVSKLQQYIIDVEQSTLKEEFGGGGGWGYG
jgi:hypothetical protein